ncbi:mucin-5AC-like [Ischnura elegans]|uniref:mucin-5AC-like n=1 Tax=Ischnura elegans TaxID=197161 RepID=UPI001ED88D0D|nr:mucin-5AC-like [Ischnura elegans]
MANLKVLLAVTALVTACQALKPPGYVEKPPVHDESPPNYAFDYEVRDHDGGAQGHTEVRKGIFAVGGYYSRLPGDSGAQRVAYYADDWGFHPVLVAYGGRGYSTRLAFGDKAVATANAAATGEFSGASAIKSIGVHVPQSVNPLPDLTQTGAAALAAENPQKPDADQLLASVGAPPAPPQPPKPVLIQKPAQPIGVIPVVTPRPPVYSSASSSVVLPAAASFVRPVPTYSPQVVVSTPRPTVLAAVTPTVTSHISPVIVHHGSPTIHTGPAVVTSHVAPVVTTVSPPPAPVKSTNVVVSTVPKLIAPLLPVHTAPPTATSYVSSTVSSHAAAPAVATAHVVPAGTTYLPAAVPSYSAVSNVAVGGAYNGASSFHVNVPQVVAIRNPTPTPFYVSSTPAPIPVVQEGFHEIKTNNEAVYYEVSTPAVSYVSSTPATPVKASVEFETSTVAPKFFTQEKGHIKESAAAAAAAAASALAAASATGSGSGFNYQESTLQSGEEAYYSQSSHSEGGGASYSSSSFSSSSGENEAAQNIDINTQQEYSQEGGYNYEEVNVANKENEANLQQEINQEGGYNYNEVQQVSKESGATAQQEISQNGGYIYERPSVGLTYTPQVGTTNVKVESGGAVEQGYQYPVNFQQMALFYNPGFQVQYQETPQYVYTGGLSSSSVSSSSSSQSSSSSSSGVNIGDSGGTSSLVLNSKPQGATSFQSHVDESYYSQDNPSISQTETPGNGYQGINVQVSGGGYEEQQIVTTERPQFAVEEGYEYQNFGRPIVVAETPTSVSKQRPIIESSTLPPPTASPTLAPDYAFPTSTPSSPPAVEVTTPTPVTDSAPISPYYSTFPAKQPCRSCQYSNNGPTTPSTLTAVEVTTPAPTLSPDDINAIFTSEPPRSECSGSGCQSNGNQEGTTPSPPNEEITTSEPVTSSEPITPFYSTFPANSICRSCQYTRTEPITLLTAPATDSTSPTLDEELQQVFFPTAAANIDSEDKTVETTQSIDVTPKPFSADESYSTETTRPPTVSVEVVHNEENHETTSSAFQEYTQSAGTTVQGLSSGKGSYSFSHGPFGSDQFLSHLVKTARPSFSSDQQREVYPSGVGNQIYTQTSGEGNQYYSSNQEANKEQQSFSSGSAQQSYNTGSVQQSYQEATEEKTGGEEYYNGGQVYTVTSTPAPPARGQQQHSFAVNPSPPSVLYVDRPVAVPVPYAVPQYVPYAVKGSSSYKGKGSHRTSSSSSSSDSYESSTPSVISVTQITKIRTSGRKTADRGYVKQIVQEESSSEEEDEEGEEVVIKGGSVKVRPGSFRQQGYFRPAQRPSAFRASSVSDGSSAVEGGLKYGDRIRIDRPRKLCIEYDGFKAPLIPSQTDYSHSINLR